MNKHKTDGNGNGSQNIFSRSREYKYNCADCSDGPPFNQSELCFPSKLPGCKVSHRKKFAIYIMAHLNIKTTQPTQFDINRHRLAMGHLFSITAKERCEMQPANFGVQKM